MNLFRSFLGRRQFLMTAGLASGCALTCKKLAGFQTKVTMAAEQAAAAGVKASASKCPHLLSPLRIRNVVLKNRIMHTVSPPYLLQGPENYPADAYRNHYSNMAKNAAIVSMNTHFGAYPKTYTPNQHGPSANFSDDIWEDIPPVHNYVERMIEDIHCEGALVYYAGPTGPLAMSTSGGLAVQGTEAKEAGTAAQTSGDIEAIVAEAKALEDQGYDVYKIDTNTTTLEAVEAVRNATGLIIMAYLGVGSRSMGNAGAKTPGVSNDNQPSVDEIEQAVEMARKLEGLVDFAWIRDPRSGSWAQDKGRPAGLAYSEAIKKAGIDILTCPGTDFLNPVENDSFIASGKIDMVGMTRPLFADPDLVKKVKAGRADDVVPCVSCQNCHGLSMTNGPWYQSCTVNPKWATPAYKLQNISAPLEKKKVAVIGGGPGGMKAAIVAAERGHAVTLYEKEAALGGLQRHTDYTRWKWTYKDFKDYLAHQVNKAGVEVKLKTTATPKMIQAAGYDAVLVATGATPAVSRMPGADGDNVFDIMSAYSNKKAIGKNVVIIGAGVYGTETAMCLAKDGHDVTILTSAKQLIPPEAIGPHNMQNQQDISRNHPGIHSVLKAVATRISEGKVYYRDASGSEKSAKADSVVIYTGLTPNMDEAMKFKDSAEEVLLLGDCTGRNGTILRTIRSAFFTASRV